MRKEAQVRGAYSESICDRLRHFKAKYKATDCPA